MSNFVLVNLRLEDKRDVRVCDECGEQFRSTRMRKYCSRKCSHQQQYRFNKNPFSKRKVTDKVDHLERPTRFLRSWSVGVAESTIRLMFMICLTVCQKKICSMLIGKSGLTEDLQSVKGEVMNIGDDVKLKDSVSTARLLRS